MAFSFRHIISNIPYFKKEDTDNFAAESPRTKSDEINFTKRGNKLKNESNSDTEKKSTKKPTKLKIDVEKANKSIDGALTSDNSENTPQKVTLHPHSSQTFTERLKEFDLNKSVDVFELMNENNFNVESLSEHSDSELSDTEVKMCRKVGTRSSSVESFTDVELEGTEDERATLLNSYQLRFEKYGRVLHKLLTELQFHIEVSKIFHTKTITTTDFHNLPKKLLGEIDFDCKSRSESPSGPWNVIIENEDEINKLKIKEQLVSLRQVVTSFIDTYLEEEDKTIELKAVESKKQMKKIKVNKKKFKKSLNNFPDYRESLHNLFRIEDDQFEESFDKCTCRCHLQDSHTDSGLTKDSNQSISSSIGNFTVGTTSLSNYSESLDNVISYSSYNSTLYSTVIQKAAMERITFYVKVHGIELSEFELDITKSSVHFKCHSCKLTLNNEYDLLKHILSQKHCERTHFLYKTSYIMKCFRECREIQPSTVLNSMPYYRDMNKIVCFGDCVYACSLCLEMNIVGESVLIEHCYSADHLDRKEKMYEFFDGEI